MALWRTDPLYKPFYHKSGLVWVDNSGLPRTVISNYGKLNATDKCRLCKPEEVKALWSGVHADADYDNVTEMLVNESSGWAEATKALKKVIEAAVTSGVKYVPADVKEVVFDDQGSATGVRTQDGDVLSASHIILATGATTAKLLADSTPQRKEIQIGGRAVAAAVCTAMISLSDKEAEYFRQGPVFVHEVGHTIGGSIPPNPENQLKVYRDLSFTNTVYHEASGQSISIPPASADYGASGNSHSE